MRERELPLTALRAFAVAARAASLAAAAQQLGVTHGAVSKQIAALEDWLGQPLFDRHRRTLALTPYGRILAERVGASIRDIGAACAAIRRERARRVIAVEAPATFAMYVLLPRIAAFEAQHPRLSVWISTRMTGQPADLANHDLVISRGPLVQGATRVGPPTPLFEEALTPVGSVPLLRERPVRRPEDLGRHTAIASASRPGEWEAWFAQAGLGSPRIEGGHRFDHLHVALHAVRDGLGLTIAPRQIFADAGRRYRLRCPLAGLCVPGATYLAYATRRSDLGETEAFAAWLRRQCGGTDGHEAAPPA